MKFTSTLTLFLILFVFGINGQKGVPDVYSDSNDTSHVNKGSLKSLQVVSAAYSYLSSYHSSKGYYSDYWLYFTCTGLSYQCDCSNHKYSIALTLYHNGATSTSNIGSFTGTGYSSTGLRKAVGPSYSGTWNYKGSEGGDDTYETRYLVITKCWDACGAYYHKSSAVSFTGTTNIRSPKSATASNNEWDHKIKITVTAGTDIPAGYHGYIVERTDGLYTHEYPYNTFNFYDETCQPGKTYTYRIYTYSRSYGGFKKSSGYVTATGSTFGLNLDASIGQANKVILTWDDPTGKGKGTLDGYDVKRYDEENDLTETIANLPDNRIDLTDNDATLIPGYLYRYTLLPQPESEFFPDTAWGKTLPNGRIKGKIISPTGHGIPNVNVCAIRTSDVPQDTTTRYCATTDEMGEFDIKNIYYYDEANFKLVPTKEGHGFSPGEMNQTLYLLASQAQGKQFIDTSAFSVFGNVIQVFEGDTCPVPDVDIYLEGNEEPETSTGADGMYALSVSQIGDYTIIPSKEMHGFIPVEKSCLVESDTTLESFVDTTMFKLSGYVTGSCNTYFGQALVQITTGPELNHYIDTLIMTDSETGYYEIELPAREYQVSINKFYSEIQDIADEDVETYFATVSTDLTYGNDQVDFTYRSKPEIEITGFLDYGCGSYDGIPIVEQGYQYVITISLKDAFQDISCDADTGMVIIVNNVGNMTNEEDTVYISGGTAEYSFIPGDPNLIAPHLKNLTFTAHLGFEEVTKSLDILVEGNKPRESTFTTVSPEIPFLILRDPPGDGSYSYMEQGTTTQTAMRFSAQASGSVKVWKELKVGTKFLLGAFGNSVETEIWGKVNKSLEVGASISGQEEFLMSITNSEIFKTSGNDNVTGESGDVFAGSAMNMIYALTDVIKYNPEECAVNKSVDLSVGVEDFATTFIYTESHIRNVLIPQLTYLHDLYEKSGNDSAAIYANQIDVWQQTLKMNTDLKKSSGYINNVSFSSGVEYENSQEVSTNESGSLEFSMYIEATVAAEAGIEIAGVGGSAGVEAKFRVEVGGAVSKSVTMTKKTGFVLNDDDPGDAFSVDIRSDNTFGTPVFRLVSGQSSCPWEPGSQAREGLQLTSDKYVSQVNDPDGSALFYLQLGNISQSEENRSYMLVFDQASNPDGAVLTLGGSQVQGGVPTPYFINYGESKQATVTVSRGPEAFDYNNLQFTLYSDCDDQIRDTVLLDVHFSSPCSDVKLTKPGQNWSLSSVDNNRMRVTLSDYDLDLLDNIKVQIANKGVNNWISMLYLDKENLSPGSTNSNILVDQFDDGLYELRALLECNSGKVYSDVLEGVIDRQAPGLFGLPEPSDLSLDDGDVIMATFDEEVNCYRLSDLNVELTNLSTDEVQNASVGCYGNTVVIIPDITGNAFQGDTFNVKLSGIEDHYGNVIDEPVSWTFRMNTDPTPSPDDDTDGDGILNGADNCPYSANSGQEDMNNDGEGDACDTDIDGDGVPNVSDNCVFTANPDQIDSDDDGVGDACQNLTGLEEVKNNSIVYMQNIPNPFNDYTNIRYTLSEDCEVTLSVYDMTGKMVDNLLSENQPKGQYSIPWHVNNQNPGIYFCRILVKSSLDQQVKSRTIKMVLIK